MALTRVDARVASRIRAVKWQQLVGVRAILPRAAFHFVLILAMIFHEHMMTISQEVRYVWGQRLTVATMIFLLNRYMVLILGITIILQTVDWDTPLVSCFSIRGPFLFIRPSPILRNRVAKPQLYFMT